MEGPRRLEIWATDASAAALELFAENLAATARHRPDVTGRVHGARGSWFDALPSTLVGHLHMVVANPPYVSAAEWELLEPVVRDHEPRGALVSGPTGLEDLDQLVRARGELVGARWCAGARARPSSGLCGGGAGAPCRVQPRRRASRSDRPTPGAGRPAAP